MSIKMQQKCWPTAAISQILWLVVLGMRNAIYGPDLQEFLPNLSGWGDRI